MSDPGDVERLKRAAQAANVLCELLWEALRAELDAGAEGESAADAASPSTQRTIELARRIADIAATLALLASADRQPAVAPQPETAAGAASAAGPGAVWMDARDEPAGQPGRLMAGAST